MGRWFLNFDFHGRATRGHVWANLFAWIGVASALVVAASMVSPAPDGSIGGGPASVALLVLFYVAMAVATVDQLTTNFRRAHDTGRTGWICLLLLLPLANLLALYWLMLADGQPGANKYGPPIKPFQQVTQPVQS